jgi:hypothetical protein
MAVRQSVVLASRNVAVEKFMYELDALLSGFAQPVPTRRLLKRVVLFFAPNRRGVPPHPMPTHR